MRVETDEVRQQMEICLKSTEDVGTKTIEYIHAERKKLSHEIAAEKTDRENWLAAKMRFIGAELRTELSSECISRLTSSESRQAAAEARIEADVKLVSGDFNARLGQIEGKLSPMSSLDERMHTLETEFSKACALTSILCESRGGDLRSMSTTASVSDECANIHEVSKGPIIPSSQMQSLLGPSMLSSDRIAEVLLAQDPHNLQAARELPLLAGHSLNGGLSDLIASAQYMNSGGASEPPHKIPVALQVKQMISGTTPPQSPDCQARTLPQAMTPPVPNARITGGSMILPGAGNVMSSRIRSRSASQTHLMSQMPSQPHTIHAINPEVTRHVSATRNSQARSSSVQLTTQRSIVTVAGTSSCISAPTGIPTTIAAVAGFTTTPLPPQSVSSPQQEVFSRHGSPSKVASMVRSAMPAQPKRSNFLVSAVEWV